MRLNLLMSDYNVVMRVARRSDVTFGELSVMLVFFGASLEPSGRQVGLYSFSIDVRILDVDNMIAIVPGTGLQ